MGQIQVALQCQDSPHMVRLSAWVHAYRQVPVLLRPVGAGQTLTAEDWALRDVDVASLRSAVVENPEDLAGAEVTRNLRAGDPVPRHALRAGELADAGDPVRVWIQGSGFRVGATGRLLQRVAPGQSARVQLDSGRTVMGVLQTDRSVVVAL
jgi:flagella basal body P-ring formation protein FlgA